MRDLGGEYTGMLEYGGAEGQVRCIRLGVTQHVANKTTGRNLLAVHSAKRQLIQILEHSVRRRTVQLHLACSCGSMLNLLQAW